MRRALPPIAVLAIVAMVVVGALQAGGGGLDEPQDDRFDLQAALQRLEGAPAPLARLHAQANELRPQDEWRPALKALRGTPVVVNKWGSWCTPCREEFPVFQQVATELGKEVAFVGLDGNDNAQEARAFLREMPTPFPHYEDPDVSEARRLRGTEVFPNTIFVGADGEVAFVHQGPYRSAADLRRDVERYAR